MGDFADDAIDRMFDEQLDAQGIPYDAFSDFMYDEETGATEYPRMQTAKRCKHCRKNNLHWTPTENGWRLAEPDGRIHDCSQYRRKRVTK